jgi:putative protein-disulfide isomerase
MNDWERIDCILACYTTDEPVRQHDARLFSRKTLPPNPEVGHNASMSEQEPAILYYVHDPMCSWCWGFRPAWSKVLAGLPAPVVVRRVLGGLAPDDDTPMNDKMRAQLQSTWRRIQERIPGTGFNFDFWSRCQPRRSTYPACRAVIAARHQGPQYDEAMTLAIQRAYYTQARNPSDHGTLVELAAELELDTDRFEAELDTPATRSELMKEIGLARRIGAHSFPSLVLEVNGSRWPVAVAYTAPDAILTDINSIPEDQGGY